MDIKIVIILLFMVVLVGCAPIQKTYSKLPEGTKLKIQKEYNNLTQSEIDQKYQNMEKYVKANYPQEFKLYSQTCSYYPFLIKVLILGGLLSFVGLVTYPAAGLVGVVIGILLVIVNWSSILCILS
ncbi:MAG TPA: hypothetical protein VJB12_04815 [Candidatus Nanoarchaeia archaeon]|nr:hypothetical protein [Candidatus Nanoarchaeia archaeon]